MAARSASCSSCVTAPNARIRPSAAAASDARTVFISLKYKMADVVFDGGSLGGGIPTSHAYFLNTNYLGLSVHRDANMTEIPELRSVNQDAVVIPVLWQGNLVCSNRSLQGVMKA